jgi:hypothetical protein
VTHDIAPRSADLQYSYSITHQAPAPNGHNSQLSWLRHQPWTWKPLLLPVRDWGAILCDLW